MVLTLHYCLFDPVSRGVANPNVCKKKLLSEVIAILSLCQAWQCGTDTPPLSSPISLLLFLGSIPKGKDS